MKNRKKKMTAPIAVTVFLVLYMVVYFGFLISLAEGIWKYVLGAIPFVLCAVIIGVCVERIREIQRGEEDDLGKY